MKAERLRDDETPWGLTRLEHADRERVRLRRIEANRRQAAKQRNAKGHFLAVPKPAVPLLGTVWAVASFWGLLAFTEGQAREFTTHSRTVGRTHVSLPFVSLLYGSKP